MGIYDRRFSFGFLGWGKDRFAIIIGAAAIVLVFLLAALVVWSFFAPKPLTLWLDRNPIGATDTVWLHAQVTNTTDKTLNNLVVEVEAVDKAAIQISQGINQIAVLGRGERREVKFLVNPVSQAVLTGNYIIKASVRSGSETIGSAEITLTIQRQA